jgi:hypothetical protein
MEQQYMSQADRKTTAEQRMQPVLIDAEGQIWPVTSPFFWVQPRRPDGNIIDYAVSRLGFINIWPIDGSSIVVSLRPDLVHPKTMTAAFYAMADLQPVRVFISATNRPRQGWELFMSLERALKRIDRLVSAARRSSIGTRLMRAWENLGVSDSAPFRHASRLLDLCDLARRRGDAARLISRPARPQRRTSPRCGKAAMSTSALLAAGFLTRLDVLSSLSFVA